MWVGLVDYISPVSKLQGSSMTGAFADDQNLAQQDKRAYKTIT
jgi:hypothetical protein